MSFGAIAIIVCLVTTILGIAATHPLELRDHRWLKIILSFPPVLMITSAAYETTAVNAYFGAFSFGILGFIWKSPMAHFFSLVFMRLLNGDLNRPTGIRAEFGAAKSLRKHGDIDDAFMHTRRELEKDPFNYEGLLLLAQLHIDVDEPERALEALDLILAKTPLTADQRAIIIATRQSVEESVSVGK